MDLLASTLKPLIQRQKDTRLSLSFHKIGRWTLHDGTFDDFNLPNETKLNTITQRHIHTQREKS